jgi:microcystin-dependent protein
MTRKIFTDGMVLPAEDVNAIATPIPDGEDLIGHGDKIIDLWLDDSDDQIKARFYGFYNRFRVTASVGLEVLINSGVVNAGGTLISIPSQSLILPNNANSYIYIGIVEGDPTIAVRRSASPVVFNHIPLAYVVTASGSITVVNDLRYENAPYIAPERVQLVNPGDVIFSMSRGAVPIGYLEMNGQNVSRTTYDKLWEALGSPDTGNGTTTFTIPSVDGLFVGMTTGIPGNISGNNSITLQSGNLPAHSHQIDDVAHSHTINQIPHTHTVSQSPHNHGVIDGQHAHGLPGWVYDQDASEGSDGSGSAFAPTGSGTYLASSNISIQAASANVAVEQSNISVSLNTSVSGITQTRNTGNGTPINISPRSMSLRAFIKY